MKKKQIKVIDFDSQVQSSTRITEINVQETNEVVEMPAPVSTAQKDTTTVTPKVEPTIIKSKEQANSFSNNFSYLIPVGEKLAWLIVSASAKGKSHEGRLPCQDNHYCASINASWGIAIVCDGAGSAVNSHLGSAYVANELAVKFFKEVVINNGWHLSNILPSPDEWNRHAREACIKIYSELTQYAGHSGIQVSSLASTLIVIIYSPSGLLVTHIGDGRAGYLNEQGEWKAIITPHKGEEVNQTIFITSDKWITDPSFFMSGKPVPESNVISEKAVAFTAMSDGCELHSFECSMMNTSTNKWYDPNTPYSKFFDPLVKNLRLMHESNLNIVDSNDKWRKFIEAGNSGLESEPDDKTMILGIDI